MEPTTWSLDSDTFASPVQRFGRPCVVEGAMEFHGEPDGLVVAASPLAGCGAFTIEAVFRQDPGPPEQRFLHVQSTTGPTRALLETRVTPEGRWYADTFLHGGTADQFLNDPALLHPCGTWSSLALVFDGSEMRQYANGRLELFAAVAGFEAFTTTQVALGMRINHLYHFHGALRTVRFSPRVLEAHELLPA